jgi:hypothetical protein
VAVFSGCNNLDTGNSRTFTDVFAVVKSIDYFQNNLVTFGTSLGDIVAPEQISTPLSIGECVYFSQFTIDYDNQPSDQYILATGVLYQTISKAPFVPSAVPFDGYDLKLTEVQTLASPYFEGNLFVGSNYSKLREQSVTYRLVWDKDEPAENNGAFNVYLQAKLVGTATGTAEDISDVRAFDLQNFLWTAGRDTIANNVNFRYAKINLKYLSGVEGGEPVYTQLDSPIELSIFTTKAE